VNTTKTSSVDTGVQVIVAVPVSVMVKVWSNEMMTLGIL
jgi:hypothetical protein